MSKIDFIRGEMVAAMKAKDKARKDVLSLLLAGQGSNHESAHA